MLAPKYIKKTLVVYLFSSLFFLTPSIADVYMVVGDSMSAAHNMATSQGWVSLLEKDLKQMNTKNVLINVSSSGDHARLRAECKISERIPCLKKSLKKYRPDWVILELGGNDALSFANTQDIYNSLEKMIGMSIRKGAKVVLAGIRIPDQIPASVKVPKNVNKQQLKQYLDSFNAIYPRLANAYKVRFVPNMFANVLGKPGMMQADGIHASIKAQPLIKNHVLKALTTSP